jgi:signal transduction histidine kinase/DNA-binding response OmpR family regulator
MNATAPHWPILVLTGQEDDQLAIESVRHGAQDYLVKGQARPVVLLRAVYQAIERKKSEKEISQLNKELQRKVAELETIFSTVPIGLTITEDADGRHIRGNPAIERMVGVAGGGELSKNAPHPAEYRCLCEGRELPAEELPMQKAARGELVNGQILDIVRADRNKITLISAASPLFDEENKPRGAVGAFLDITSLKRAEARTRLLSEVTARLLAADRPQEAVESLCRKAMEHLDCQMFFNFLLDDQAGKLHLNACAGISDECVRQIEWLDLGTAVCGCAARDRCRIVVEDVQECNDPSTELVRSFGIQAYACHPLLDSDRVIGTLSFGSCTKTSFSDDELELMKTLADHVSIAMQRMRLLQSLEEHARIAEAANVAKSQFLTNMSHELRTPMNAIVGMTELALTEELTPVLRDYLETARDSAGMLLQLLNEILDFSRIETGFFALEPAPFSLRQMLDQTLKTMRVRAMEKGLELRIKLPDHFPDEFIGDALRLRQILINLIGNAIKFTPSGSISVRVEELKGKVGQDAGGVGATSAIADKPDDKASVGITFLQFAVQDTGIGIAEADQRKVFEPFAQADASTTRNYGGTGLGLAISSNLVRLMGGEIWVESQIQHGSTFYFTVALEQPLVQREFVGSDTVALARGNGESRRTLQILLAEDNLANQKMAVYLLKKQGHAVEITNNGREAVELVNRRDFDLVLMDVQMPIMDGFQATAAIRALPNASKARMPIVAMTAHSMKGDKERCLAAGMDGYLTKPIDSRELFATLANLPNGNSHGEN